jgi:predicted transcriptional regulator
MRARGMNQMEIAHELHVSEASISSDMQYLRNQGKESIKEYLTEYLPEQYQVCLVALDSIIRRASDIIETSHDNREKLQAMELFSDTHLVKLELLSNAVTIDSALNYIKNRHQQQQHNQQQQKQQQREGQEEKADNNDNNNDSAPTHTQTVF